MIEPLKASRDDFPRSTASSEGMILLENIMDNNEMRMIKDIEYISRNDISLTIQLILPDITKEKPPLIVYVTGSAFHWQNITETIPRLCLLANRGFAVASAQYRGSDVAPFPAQALDIKAAVRFLKLNADKYGYDENNVWIMGDSSGGHTALMAGLTIGIESFEENIYSEADSSVRGIIDLYGPVNISKMNDEPSSQNHIEADSPEGFLIGRKNVAENPKLAEPTVITNYICAGREIPPVLIFHGTNDELVPFGQSCILYDKLKEQKKAARFYAIDGAHHGGREFWSDRILCIIEAFIKKGEL
ncbi:MAG: alpha/beta hydrolase fold domain-containing protein [Lachnospiraceae bacterium]